MHARSRGTAEAHQGLVQNWLKSTCEASLSTRPSSQRRWVSRSAGMPCSAAHWATAADWDRRSSASSCWASASSSGTESINHLHITDKTHYAIIAIHACYVQNLDLPPWVRFRHLLAQPKKNGSAGNSREFWSDLKKLAVQVVGGEWTGGRAAPAGERPAGRAGGRARRAGVGRVGALPDGRQKKGRPKAPSRRA